MILLVLAIGLSLMALILNTTITNEHEHCRRVEAWQRYYSERRDRNARLQNK